MYQTTSLNIYKHFDIGSVHCDETGVTFFVSSKHNDDEVVIPTHLVIDYIQQFLYENERDWRYKAYKDMGETEVIETIYDEMSDGFYNDLIKDVCNMRTEHPSEVIAWDSFNAFVDFMDGWAIEATKNPSRVPAWIAAVLNNGMETSYTNLTEYENKALNILRTNYNELIALRAQSFSGLSSMFGNFQTAYN